MFGATLTCQWRGEQEDITFAASIVTSGDALSGRSSVLDCRAVLPFLLSLSIADWFLRGLAFCAAVPFVAGPWIPTGLAWG